MAAWTPELELELVEACYRQAKPNRRRDMRPELQELRAAVARRCTVPDLRALAEQADAEARGRPGYRADTDG